VRRETFVGQRNQRESATPDLTSLISMPFHKQPIEACGEVCGLMIAVPHGADVGQLIALEQPHEQVLHSILRLVLTEAATTRVCVESQPVKAAEAFEV
jgi:hypothetical protein